MNPNYELFQIILIIKYLIGAKLMFSVWFWLPPDPDVLVVLGARKCPSLWSSAAITSAVIHLFPPLLLYFSFLCCASLCSHLSASILPRRFRRTMGRYKCWEEKWSEKWRNWWLSAVALLKLAVSFTLKGTWSPAVIVWSIFQEERVNWCKPQACVSKSIYLLEF